MVNSHIVQKQLHAAGADNLFWGKAERAELPKIMISGEIIEHVQHGHYEGGFATLVATNHRLLLVDKKPFFLNVIDLRYDMIAEVDYGHNVVAATIHVHSSGNDFRFQSFNQKNLRQMCGFIQSKVIESRRQKTADSNPATQPIATPARQAIPMQVFQNDTGLTDEQANGLIPLSHAVWKKVDPRQHQANPYNSASLLNRRRVGRFDFANNK